MPYRQPLCLNRTLRSSPPCGGSLRSYAKQQMETRSMWTKQIRVTAIVLALVANTARGASAQIPSSGSSTCLGGAIGCEQVDFFLNFTESTGGPVAMNYFRI